MKQLYRFMLGSPVKFISTLLLRNHVLSVILAWRTALNTHALHLPLPWKRIKWEKRIKVGADSKCFMVSVAMVAVSSSCSSQSPLLYFKVTKLRVKMISGIFSLTKSTSLNSFFYRGSLVLHWEVNQITIWLKTGQKVVMLTLLPHTSRSCMDELMSLLLKSSVLTICTKMRGSHSQIYVWDRGPKRCSFRFIRLSGLYECVAEWNGEIVCSMRFCVIWMTARSDAGEIIKRPSSTLVKITWSNGS